MNTSEDANPSISDSNLTAHKKILNRNIVVNCVSKDVDATR